MSVRVLRNVVNYGALNGGSKALKLLALLTLARALAPASFAVVGFAWGFVEVFRVVATAGLDQWTTRTLVNSPGAERRVIHVSTKFVRKFIALALLACPATAILMRYDQTMTEGVGIVMLALPAAGLAPIYASVFESRLETGKLAAYYLFPSLLTWGIALAALTVRLHDPLIILALMVLAEYFGLALLWRRVQSALPQAETSVCPVERPNLSQTAPIGIQRVLWALCYRGDLMALGLLAPAAVIGTYSAGSKLAESLYLLGAAIGITLFPLMARTEQANSLGSTENPMSLDWIVLAVFSACGLGALLANPVMTGLLQYPYNPLTITALFFSVGWSVTNFLVTSSLFAKTSTLRPSLAYLTGLPVLWIAAFALWPRLGAAGIAVARLLQEVTILLVLLDAGRTSVKIGLRIPTLGLAVLTTFIALVGSQSTLPRASVVAATLISLATALYLIASRLPRIRPAPIPGDSR
jgi:O-antigen/teichoic acid export membrane protein